MVESERNDAADAQSTQAISMAGISIFESLLLSLIDNGVLERKEVYGLLSDAAEAHRQHSKSASDGNLHARIAAVIEALRNGGDSTKPGEWLT